MCDLGLRSRIVNLKIYCHSLFFFFIIAVSTRDVTNRERSIIDTYNMADKGHKPHLDMDQAWLTIRNNASSNLEVFVQSHECYKVCIHDIFNK